MASGRVRQALTLASPRIDELVGFEDWSPASNNLLVEVVTMGRPSLRVMKFDGTVVGRADCCAEPTFSPFCVEARYDRVERRIEIMATVSEAVAKAFENAKDLSKEVSRVTLRDIAGARYVPQSDARVVEEMRLAA